MNKRTLIVVLGVIQALTAAVLPIIAIGMVMGAWNTNSPPSDSTEAIMLAAEVLRFPIATPFTNTALGQLFPGVLGYIPLLLNGWLWAWIIVTLGIKWKNRHASPRVDVGTLGTL